jgi:uncharacterized membrane protein
VSILGILDIFGKRNEKTDAANGPTFMVSTELFPYKLEARKSITATLSVKIRNVTKDVLLASVVVEVPSQLGLDEMNLSKQKDLKVGEMQPQELKEVQVKLYSGLKSDPGEYTLTLTAIAHYRDYTHVLNEVRKRVAVEII